MESDLKAVSLFFHALSDEGRMRLVILLESGEKSVTELTELSGEKMVNVSARLRDLLHHRLDVSHSEGRKTF